MDDFYDAVRNGDVDFVVDLFRRNVLSNTSDLWSSLVDGGETVAHNVIASQSIPLFDLMMETLDRYDIVDCVGQTMLHWAVDFNHMYAVRELIFRGAQTDVLDTNGSSPLVVASGLQDSAIMKLLIDHGANPNIPSTRGPFSFACRNGRLQSARFLMNLVGRDEIIRNNPFALYDASVSGQKTCCEWLVSQGYDPFQLLDNYVCAAFWMARNGWVDMLSCHQHQLVKRSLVTRHTETCLHFALRHSDTSVVYWLVEHGVSLETKDMFGHTALSMSFSQSLPQHVLVLISLGARRQDMRGWNDRILDVECDSASCHGLVKNMHAIRRAHLLGALDCCQNDSSTC